MCKTRGTANSRRFVLRAAPGRREPEDAQSAQLPLDAPSAHRLHPRPDAPRFARRLRTHRPGRDSSLAHAAVWPVAAADRDHAADPVKTEALVGAQLPGGLRGSRLSRFVLVLP